MTGPAPARPTRRPLHNRLLVALLQSPVHRPLDRSVVALQISGVRTGRLHELPVMYADDGTGLVVWPGRPETKRWWRNLRRPAPVQILHEGRWQPATGELLRPGDRGYDGARESYRRRWRRVVIGPSDPLVRITVGGRAGPSSRTI